MMRFLSVFLLLVSFLYSNEYPKRFEQLSTPLFDSAKPIMKLSDIQSIKQSSETYLQNLEDVRELGFKVDKSSNKKEIASYLSKLRKLQKMHNYILYEINKNIESAIDNNDYKLFSRLTQHEFNGLLKNRALLDKAIKFYKKNKIKKKIFFFDKKIKYKKLVLATSKEFYNIVHKATYNSSNKQHSKKSVNLIAKDMGEYISVHIENKNPYSVTVKLKEDYENLHYDKSTNNVFALNAGDVKEYTKLYKQKGSISYSYNYSYSWIIGSIDAVHDDNYLYRLPFARGESQVVSQGFNGKFSHKGHSQYAIDFAMNEGTKIYAARDGIVVKTKSDSNKGGVDKKFSSSGNYVTIEHNDSTLATYYHLKQNGVAVNVRDKVNRGDFIGYSGNTGYSSGPHLHFAVFKADSATRTKTIPVKFDSQDGVIDEPKVGNSYVAK